MPAAIHKEARWRDLAQRHLTYEAVNQLTKLGIRQSTCIGIGGDPVIGTNFIDALELFKADKQTKAVLISARSEDRRRRYRPLDQENFNRRLHRHPRASPHHLQDLDDVVSEQQRHYSHQEEYRDQSMISGQVPVVQYPLILFFTP